MHEQTFDMQIFLHIGLSGINERRQYTSRLLTETVCNIYNFHLFILSDI